MSLRARIVVRRDSFRLGVTVGADAGQVVALLGPNGAGKSTVLAALAGLLRPDEGRIVLDDVVLVDTERGVHLPPQRRQVGMVVQDYLLFPHMSALENVAFGLRARGTPREAAHLEATAWLDRMGVGALSRRRPRELSGGQAQRIALGRALVVRPRLLLLDEPLAALDAGTRPVVRADLRRHLEAFDGCTVVVTHDPLEALVLGDRIVVLEHGTIVQEGPPGGLARHPRTDYVRPPSP